ncbi:MAG: valine--tRNA ligase [Candidatus Saccharimonadales bacterium]
MKSIVKLPKTYEPNQYEANIYALWEKSGAFKPRSSGKPYSVVVPPPNANASLHIGFALTMSLQDIAVRYHRIRGERALFVPGADHAGFETQAVYEKRLAEAGKSRFDFTREELYQQIWDFVAQNRKNYDKQFRSLGGSVDWSRFSFTLDDKIVHRAYATFQKMWQEGLVYRGERLINFCTFHGTAFADIEVVHKNQKGKLYYIRYPLTDGSGEIIVATTRPETMLGDTAVAVHPKDKKYNSMVGKTVKLPLTNREIPIISDSFVDMSFGTGAVKLTPAHDHNDFETGKRHDLPMMTVIDYEGKLTHDVPAPYRGLNVEAARQKIVADLKGQGALVKIEDYVNSVGHCYKCDTVIQPLLREQWFVNMQPLAKRAIEALKTDKIAFYPTAKRVQLIKYLESLKDWNISRQIAWGIPIPAFQNIDDPEEWIYDERVGDEIIIVEGKTYRRDPDVFDTWFSSSSWPYATLDYPDSQDFKLFYPLSLMETGGEILYPWVSRMIMLGLYVTDEIPFKSVYIHGYVMSEDGSKMSKSLGNTVNAPEVINKYGSDALRMGIIAGRVPAVNRGYDHRKVEEARHFCNKLWNIARYIEALTTATTDHSTAKPQTVYDHWILSKLHQLQSSLEQNLDDYRFAEAYELLYHFVWDDLADWYIEASKAKPNDALLAKILEIVLVLAHPFAPFMTEAIWQTLDWTGDSLLTTRLWPDVPKADEKKTQYFADIQPIVTETRFITKMVGASDATLYYTAVPFLAENAQLIKLLTGLANVTEVKDGTGFYLTGTPYRCWLDIEPSTASRIVEQLDAKLATQKEVIKKLEGRLANKTYTDRAPDTIVKQTKQQLAEAKVQLAIIEQEYKRFSPAE